jgi:hypothetical protein
MPVFGFLPFNPAGANGQAEPICWPRREALLSGAGIGLLIFSSTNLEMNQIFKMV